MQQPTFETLAPKILVGKWVRTTVAENRTFELWSGFMPRRAEIQMAVGKNLYSITDMGMGFHPKDFTINTFFNKWAAVEVSEIAIVPYEMEKLELPGGLYAVFVHHGPASTFAKTAAYIFGEWLPASEFEVDTTRVQFEVMDENYKGPTHPDAEEKVYIPVKPA